MGRPDLLARASHARGTMVRVHFADGFAGAVDIANLTDTCALCLESARVSASASALEIDDANGGTVSLDAAVLRAYCDPLYAQELEQAAKEM